MIKDLRMKLFYFCFLTVSSLTAQTSYFPPLTGDQWATVDPDDLGWCEEGIDNLYTFLDQKDTKAFIILKDGKIVIEKYFGNFTKDSIWYWASAGKSLTGFLAGVAQEKAILSIQDKTSKYLGQGWTNLTAEQESKITIWHHLSMTTGLEDDVPDDNCMIPSCLTFKAEPGTRWAYHNAPYRLTQDVIGKAWGSSYQNFMNTQLSVKTGITGLWYDGVLYSKPRSMARFGLLMLNNGNWNGQKILSDQSYIQSMISTSQQMNKSYGLLWWLNGKPSFMVPNSQFVFNGSLIPDAPDETWCALGKNDQKIYVIPTQKLVIIRMGEDGGMVTGAVSSFDNLLWKKLNEVFCTSGIDNHDLHASDINISPNPFTDQSGFVLLGDKNIDSIELIDQYGKVWFKINKSQTSNQNYSNIPCGIYFLRVMNMQKIVAIKKLIKI